MNNNLWIKKFVEIKYGDEFEPPDSEDTFWLECRSGRCYLKFSYGKKLPRQCPECRNNLYEYEG